MCETVTTSCSLRTGAPPRSSFPATEPAVACAFDRVWRKLFQTNARVFQRDRKLTGRRRGSEVSLWDPRAPLLAHGGSAVQPRGARLMQRQKRRGEQKISTTQMETCGTCGAEVPSHNMHLHQVRVSPFHIETCDRRSPCRRTANETLPNASFVATRFLGIIHQLRVGYCFDLRALHCHDASAIMKICVS